MTVVDAPIPTSSGRYLNFASVAFQHKKGHKNKHNHRQFYALCGDNPPTITQGYGKWNVIDRPLRQGITVPTGFDPAIMHIEIKFGVWDGRHHTGSRDGVHLGWDTSELAGDSVEQGIDDLHWMAGGNAEAGPSPVIYVWSGHNRGNTQSHLVPKQYWDVPWVVHNGITWGPSWRHRSGKRIYQEASFDLIGYTSLGVPAPKVQSQTAGGFFTVNVAADTAYGIAASESSHSSADAISGLARRILVDPRNNPCSASRVNLERRGQFWPIPLGTRVWVPQHHF